MNEGWNTASTTPRGQSLAYRPTLLNGPPVEVVTEIDVHFNLG